MKWETASLGEVATIERKTIQPLQLSPNSTYLGLEHIARGGDIVGMTTVTDAQVASAKYAFTSDHVLFGKLRPNLGKICRPDFEGVCSTDIFPIRPGSKLDRDYLANFLRQPSIVNLASLRATGANLPRLSLKQLETFQIPVPTMAEQKQIAAILDQADEIRTKRRAQLAYLDELPESIFHEMFGENPTSPSAELKDILKWSSGKFLPAGQQAGAPYPVYGGNGVNGGHNEYMFSEPKLIIGRVGANCGAVHVTSPQSWVTDNALVGTFLRTDITIDYMRFALLKANLNQYAATSGQPSISSARIAKARIPLPLLAEQQAFAEKVEAIQEERDRINQALEVDDELFAALQYRAFRGEL